MSVPEVKLSHYSTEHQKALDSFVLPEDQIKFTALPNKYTEVEEGQHRIVILNNSKPVGFFLLHATARVKDYSDNPKAMLLTSLSINQAAQGKGVAKQAMTQLREFVKREFPSCDELVLAVNHKNIAAQKLYEKVDFQDTGRRVYGPIGEQFVMSSEVG
ncbi:GNAT family N-acetyltransferase [Halalkalibacillus halophilus]|uniref:GNAT family N-acetyltransferase n=1 Tax=Halalkalibacillus halophilus TaxID=392827 RepID=UPI000429CDAB|nr:GNAT family N-acetyltransferase [Halalkalibacillus halophilus]